MASYYGKRPLWQWLAIYIAVGAVVYFLIYYFVLAPKGAYNNSGGYNYSNTSTSSGSTTGY